MFEAEAGILLLMFHNSSGVFVSLFLMMVYKLKVLCHFPVCIFSSGDPDTKAQPSTLMISIPVETLADPSGSLHICNVFFCM